MIPLSTALHWSKDVHHPTDRLEKQQSYNHTTLTLLGRTPTHTRLAPPHPST
jgi:hypothetical protein